MSQYGHPEERYIEVEEQVRDEVLDAVQADQVQQLQGWESLQSRGVRRVTLKCGSAGIREKGGVAAGPGGPQGSRGPAGDPEVWKCEDVGEADTQRTRQGLAHDIIRWGWEGEGCRGAFPPPSPSPFAAAHRRIEGSHDDVVQGDAPDQVLCVCGGGGAKRG